MIDLRPYIEANLYDPEADAASSIEATLIWLEDRGWTADMIVAEANSVGIDELARNAGMRGVIEFTNEQVSAALGESVEEFQSLRRLVGLAPRPDAELAWTASDVEAFAALRTSASMFSIEEGNHFARVFGSSMSRIADAAVSLLLIDLEGPLRERGGSEGDVAQLRMSVNKSFDQLAASLDPMLRLQIDEAARRSRAARNPDDDASTSRVAIGFVDLVGFTTFSQRHTIAEVSRLVRVFEEQAFDIVAERGGHVVKLIGDEVMFVAADAQAACDVALALISGFRDDHVAPRGGLAYGSLLTRGGDYYGPTVNLASRIGDLAVPYELLATTDVAARCPDVTFEPAGRRLLKGFDEPVQLVSLTI